VNTKQIEPHDLEVGAVIAEEDGETFTVTDLIFYRDYIYAHGTVTTTEQGRSVRIAPIGTTARVSRIYTPKQTLTIQGN
jgi:hypothetical protein